jgi:hypothetical protein
LGGGEQKIIFVDIGGRVSQDTSDLVMLTGRGGGGKNRGHFKVKEIRGWVGEAKKQECRL